MYSATAPPVFPLLCPPGKPWGTSDPSEMASKRAEPVTILSLRRLSLGTPEPQPKKGQMIRTSLTSSCCLIPAPSLLFTSFYNRDWFPSILWGEPWSTHISCPQRPLLSLCFPASEPKTFTVEEAVETIGFGRFHIALFLIMGSTGVSLQALSCGAQSRALASAPGCPLGQV